MTKTKIKGAIALEDGRIFEGESFGATGSKAGEVVFNTSMTGYQEVLTDPSYKGQIVTMTYPLIGNYGVNSGDVESADPKVEGFIVREYCPYPSNNEAEGALGDYLKKHDVVALSEIDTRALTRHIREAGAMRAVIAGGEYDADELVEMARQAPGLIGRDLVKEVTCEATYEWSEGDDLPEDAPHMVVYDFEAKLNILRCLHDVGCRVTVVPAGTPAKEVLEMDPDGIMLSNGPGDPAGVHSGDSAMVLPPYSLDDEVIGEIRDQVRRMAMELEVEGLMNVQLAVKDGKVYVLEINPRGSRTVPFVSKATGLPLASVAARVMAGESLAEQGVTEDPVPRYFAVKESVLPFNRFPGVDPVLGPEMKSTGEVMGVDSDFAMAFAKSQTAAGQPLPTEGRVFVSVRDADKEKVIPIARSFHEQGFELLATSGTRAALAEADIPAEQVPKLAEGRPNIVDLIKSQDVGLLINTPSGPVPRRDEVKIRGEAVRHEVPLITTIAAADAAARAVQALREDKFEVLCLQEIHGETERLPDDVGPETIQEVTAQ